MDKKRDAPDTDADTERFISAMRDMNLDPEKVNPDRLLRAALSMRNISIMGHTTPNPLNLVSAAYAVVGIMHKLIFPESRASQEELESCTPVVSISYPNQALVILEFRFERENFLFHEEMIKQCALLEASLVAAFIAKIGCSYYLCRSVDWPESLRCRDELRKGHETASPPPTPILGPQPVPFDFDHDGDDTQDLEARANAEDFSKLPSLVDLETGGPPCL